VTKKKNTVRADHASPDDGLSKRDKINIYRSPFDKLSAGSVEASC